MKKRLSEEQFQKAIKGLSVGKQTEEIGHGVLVLGRAQTVFVEMLGLTRGAVSQAVNRIWRVHVENDLPNGYEKVSAVLPGRQAYIVKKWAKAALKKREPET